MCGRFVSAAPPGELVDYFDAQITGGGLEANFNVAPTSEVYAIRKHGDPDGGNPRSLSMLRWGLVPFWAKDLKIGARLINARSETVAEKPAFRRAFAKRRCLIPADGFYEWAKVDGRKTKQPYYITRADEERLVFAGLWERWYSDSDEGQQADPIDSCTILTCEPNREMASIHDRMPVLVAPTMWDTWLDETSEPAALHAVMAPAPAGLLRLSPVTTAVNSVANNGPSLLEPLTTNELAL